MDDISRIIIDLLTVLAAGLLAGIVCKRIGISLLVGYLVVGALLGGGMLQLVTQQNHELEYLARAGALLLLFSVGIEFSLEELVRMSRFFLIGGSVQMILVAIPLTLTCRYFEMPWNAALLAGSAGALSSTVLVFKALTEWGQMATPHGRRAIGVLLFQDVALVPLMLLVPLLTQQGDQPSVAVFVVLAAKSLLFVATVLAMRYVIARWIVDLLTGLRSVELVVLFVLCLLCGVCWGAYQLGLPPALGALAAGMMLSGNRLSHQVDSIVMPFRESFAAVFFVTLGALLDPRLILEEPLLLTFGLLAMLVLKSLAAATALRLIGLSWKAAIGMGLGLAQLGEFSFLVLAEGVRHDVIREADYHRMLFVALGTLILTPELLKLGLRWTGGVPEDHDAPAGQANDGVSVRHAIVVGIGVIGRQVTSRLEMMGVDVCLIDQSPINLHPFAQQGFHTVTGDASDPQVLRRADAEHCCLMVLSIPDDEITVQVIRAFRSLNLNASIVVRCRYKGSIARVTAAGANSVVSEEVLASGKLLDWCERYVLSMPSDPDSPDAINSSTNRS